MLQDHSKRRKRTRSFPGKPTRVIAACLLSSVFFVIFGRTAWAAEIGDARFEIMPAQGVVGDGSTQVRLRLLVRPITAAYRVTDVHVRVNAGVLRSMREGRTAEYELDYLPPRVAIRTNIIFSVIAKIRGERTITDIPLIVDPPDLVRTERASGGAFDLRAPAYLVLGRDLDARISFRKPEQGTADLTANVGKIGAIHELPDGRLEATYSPPAEDFPQMAILAVASPMGAPADWLLLPLYGLADVESNTEAGAELTVDVAGTTFGPVQADSRGLARLRIAAPPGVPVGETIVTDRLGNVKKTKLRLDPPPFLRVAALCPARADKILAFAVDENAVPLASADSLVLSAASGAIGGIQQITPGIFEAAYQAPESAWLGEHVAIHVQLRGVRDAIHSCDITVTGAPPAQAQVSLEAAEYVAGTGLAVPVKVRVLDAQGQPTRRVAVDLQVPQGNVGEAQFDESKAYSFLWKPQDTFGGHRSASVQAHVQWSPEMLSEPVALPLRPAAPARVEVQLEMAQLPADGRSQTVVQAKVFDSFGNPVDDATLSGEAQGQVGTFSFVTERNQYEASYTSPRLHEPSRDQVMVRETRTEAAGETAVELLPSRRGIFLGAQAGYRTNLGKLASPVFTLDFLYRIHDLADERLSLGVQLAGTYATSEEAASGGGEIVKTSSLYLPVTGRVSYDIPAGPVVFYLGAGIGAAFVTRSTSSPSTGKASENALELVYSGFVGADLWRWGGNHLTLETTYNYSKLSGSVKGNVGGLQVVAGYRYEL